MAYSQMSTSELISHRDRAETAGDWTRMEAIETELEARDAAAAPVRSYRCPCCGDDVMDSGPVCGDCRDESCEETRDACGDLGYRDCQRERDDYDD